MNRKLTTCLACHSSSLEKVLDFGEQPLANSYLELGELDQPEKKFPLGLNRCTICSHLQLPYVVNPDLMFKDYLYVSGTSKTLRDYFKWFADFAIEKHGKNPLKVLDIACNDGSQLDAFKERGLWTYGVDPAENLHRISSKKHRVICDYLSGTVTSEFLNLGIKFDIINAQNVFAHNDQPVDFLRECGELLDADDGILFIQNSQADMIKNGEFDTIYHEHLSFWSLRSMREAADRAGLHIIDRIRTPVHGTSDLFVLGRSPKMYRPRWLNNALAMEEKENLWHPKTYVKYAERVEEILKGFKGTVHHFKGEVGVEGPWPVIGYGAAAKGNTLLNAANVKLDAIIDDNPMKQGRYTPGMHIPIISPDKLDQYVRQDQPVLFVPLAWNFYDEIHKKIKTIRNNPDDLFLKYFPEIEVIS